jgi:hypothetical protein
MERTGLFADLCSLQKLTSSRLKDTRTSSNSEAIYRDRFQPFQGGSSLLVYGMERFVAGSNHGPNIRFFDFRFPKSYYHTDAMPCDGKPPSPRVPQQKGLGGMDNTCGAAECDHSRSVACTWHAESRRDEWRPDAVLHIGNSYNYDRVYSLAKASDISSSFYCGLRGAIVEVNLTLAADATADAVRRDAPPGWRVDHSRTKLAFQEPGIGLEKSDPAHGGAAAVAGVDESWVPRIWHHRQEMRADAKGGQGKAPCSRNRLDDAYREITSELPYM